MSHTAFMRDADLFPRAASGDGEAVLVLVDRYGARLGAAAAASAGSDEAAAVAAEIFARLMTGALPTATEFAALVAAIPEAVGALGAAPLPKRGRGMAWRRESVPVTTEAVVRQLLARLPEPERLTLEGLLWQRALGLTVDEVGPRHDEPTTSLPPIDALGPLADGLGVPDAALAAPVTGVAATARRSRRRKLDRYVEGRSSARWLVPLAIMATLLAFWVGRGTLPTTLPVAPDPLPSAWPTLPPRTTRVVAQVEPTTAPAPTAPAAVPVVIVTPTRPPAKPPTATAPAAAEPPVAATSSDNVVAGGALPPTAPPLPTSAPPPLPTAPPQVAPPLPTAAPATAPPATATVPAPTPTVAPSPAATTIVPATPSLPPTTAQLALTTQSLGFGVEVGPRALVFTNPGHDPLTWRVVADSTWMDLTQTSGTLVAGASQAVGITVAREDLPTGAYNGAVQVLTNGGDGLVPVTMTISPSNTTVSAFAEPPTPIGALGCAAPTSYLVSATIAGTQAPKKAVVYFAINGGTQQTKDLTAQGQRYSATLGPFTEPGNVIYSLVITEADGNVVRSAPYTLTVTDCASRVRTVPVMPPTTQPFALGGGGHNIYTFAVTKPGHLVVTIAWQGNATRLSTLLYSPRLSEQPFEQRTGVGSLTFSFPVTEEDIAAGGTWALHLVNFESGDATGRLDLSFVPEGQPTPKPSPSATPSVAPSPSPSPTAPPATPSPTVAPSPTATPKPQPTATPSAAPSAAPSPSVNPASGAGTPTKGATPGR